MDRVTKHRMLGIFVVLGLIILLLPLLQSNKELPTEAALVKAPPFPDQPVQPVQPAQPVESVQSVQTTIPTPIETPNPNPEPSPVVSNTITPNDTPPELVNPIKDSTPITEPPINASTIKDIQEVIKEEEPIPAPKIKKIAHITHKIKTLHLRHITKPKKIFAPVMQSTKLDNNGLMNLKNAVWVIQVGNFKNKTHALKLVNQLRTNGYRAFIQHINTNDTRVFIGPEFKHASAAALANRLEEDMHIHGMVISYKPLAL